MPILLHIRRIRAWANSWAPAYHPPGPPVNTNATLVRIFTRMDKPSGIGDAKAMNDMAFAIDIDADLVSVGVIPALQSRSRMLRDRLIQESLKAARTVPFDDVSIVDICAAADCSTGAFYSRFPDKITLFKAVMVFAAAEAGPLLQSIVRNSPFDEILSRLVTTQVERYLRQETFFRSAFRVSLDSSEAWEPFRRNARNLASAYIERLRGQPEIDQDRLSLDHVRFAFQIMFSMLNNTLSNRPGPFLLDSQEFSRFLVEAMVATMKLPSK